MSALMQKKKEWEYQNQKVLVRLVQSSTEMSVESVKAAGLLTSFLLYLIYIWIRGMLALSAVFLLGPKLVRRTSPNERPQELHEFNRHTEVYIRSRLF